jgi:hypothetical protein
MHEQRDIDAAMSSEEASRLFTENFAEAQYGFVEFFADHLAACSRTFEGDLQKMLILALVGQAYLAALRRSDGREIDAVLNASRIADITAIPRQTVNRKLRAMEREGYLRRQPLGWVLNVDAGKSVAGQQLATLRANQIESVSRFLAAFDRIRQRSRSAAPT